MLIKKMLKSINDFDKKYWDDFRFHQSNSITKIHQLEEWINLTDNERLAIEKSSSVYKWRITPYYANLMDKDNPNCPIRKQAIPSLEELQSYGKAEEDPVGDRHNLKTARIIHKYPNRVVFLASDTCPVYCRHCTRKYHTTNKDGTYFGEDLDHTYEKDFQYLKDHKEISDVLLTGGDPLTLSDEKLEYILKNLRDIEHIDIIRIGSRFPILLPQRITPNLCSILKKYHPLWLNTHFNHPVEITKEAIVAIERLIDNGVIVQNQTVLLKGINDDVSILKKLNRELLKNRVRPYYLYHCDNVEGVSHFRTSLEKGVEIMNGLYGFETGFGVPQYVITTSLGKIPVPFDSLVREGEKVIVKNYKNQKMDITEYLKIEE